MTTPLLQQALEALEVALEIAQERALEVRAAQGGYMNRRQVSADKDAEQIRLGLASLRAHIEEPKGEPHPKQICLMAGAILGQPEGTCDNRHPYWPQACEQAERAYAALMAASPPSDTVSRDAARLEVAIAQRNHANLQFQRAVQIMTGIHALLYPPRFTDNDGRTFEFRSPDVHEQMQALSDRIRALPDEIAAMHSSTPTGGEQC